MREINSKILSFLYKRKLIFFFVVSIFGFLFAPKPVFAIPWYEKLANWIAARPLQWVISLIVKLAAFLVRLSSELVNWVLSPDFLKFSYTNPATNPIIKSGLSVTQGFVNMILVLVLVYIALATILRLAGYETKKLLITFIIVALLVNFAPVICGLIVDASNILLSFFTSDLKTDVFGKNITVQADKLYKSFDPNEEIGKNLEIAIQLLVIAFFLFILSFILIIIAILFMVRYLVIWLLVILSPLGFVFYILPATRKYWDLWWKQMLNWAFVGATLGFFVYLAMQLVALAPTAIKEINTSQGRGTFDAIIIYIVPVVFLGVGIVFGLSTAAMGASTVISLAKREQKRMTKTTGRAAGWVAKKGARGVGRVVEEKTRLKEIAGGVSKRVEKIPAARWFLPKKLKKYGEFRPAIEASQTEAKAFSSRINAADVMTGAVVGRRAAGRILETISRGDSQDIFQEAKKAYSGMNEKTTSDEDVLKDPRFQKKMRRILQIANNGGLLNNIVRRDPRLAGMLAGQKWAPQEYQTMSEESDAIKKATGEARPKHIADWEKEVLENKHVVETLMEQGGRRLWSAVENVKKGQQTAQRTIDEIFTESGKATWGEFVEDFKKDHKNKMAYSDALGYIGFKAAGWRAGAPPTAPTPGAAAGGTPPAPPPPPRGRRAGGAGPPTIEERLRPPGKIRPPADMAYSPSGEIKPEEQARKEWEELEKKPKGRRAGGESSKPPKGRKV